MSGAYHAHQNVLKGINFVFAMNDHKISWGVGFLLLTFPIVRHPRSHLPTPPLTDSSALHLLGCRERVSTVWEGGGHMVWLIFTALRHHSLKLCFLEGCGIRLAAPLWAASQCPLGRTTGHHILHTLLASFVLENIAPLVFKRIL